MQQQLPVPIYKDNNNSKFECNVHYMPLLGTSLVAQRSRIRLQCRRCKFRPWVEKIPWRRKWQLTPVILPGKSHGQRSLVGYGPWGGKESDMTEYTFKSSLVSSPNIPNPLWQLISPFLPGQFHAQRSLAGYSSWGCKESNMTE